MPQRSVSPLLIGTFILRMNSGAGTIVLGLLLAEIASLSAHSINSIQIGLLPVVFYTTELVLAPFLGALSDRWGRRKLLLISPLFGIVHISLFTLTPIHNPLPYLLCLQVLSGISSAISTPVVLGYLADLTIQSQAYRMRIMSFYELVTSGGIAVGTVLGGLAWESFHRNAFLLLAGAYLIAAFCMFLAPVVNQVIDRGKVHAVITRYSLVLRTPRLFIFIPAWICITALVGIWLSSQLTFLLTSPRYDSRQMLMGVLHGSGAGHLVSLVLGMVVLFFGICLLFWAFVMNAIPRLRLMFIAIGGVFLSCIALWGINHSHGNMSWSMVLWITLLLLGIFAETGFAPAALAYLADISESSAKDRGLIMGLYSVFLGLGQILGNGLGGVFAHQFGFDGLVYLSALLGSIALVSLLWLFKQEGGGVRLL